MTREDWSDIDNRILDASWYATQDYHAAFEEIRNEDPVHWTKDDKFGKHYWTITQYDHVKEVLERDRDFSSRWDMRAPRSPVRKTPEQRWSENLYAQMSHMDKPLHDVYRRPVNKHFMVPSVNKMRQKVNDYVDEIIDEVADKGKCDLVSDIAGEVPARVMLDWLNVPKEDWDYLKQSVWLFIAPFDPRFTIDDDPDKTAAIGLNQILDYGEQLAVERRKNPGDDLVTTLVNTEIDGTPLSNYELRSYMKSMIGGGLETTRNASVVGLWRFMLDGEQRQLLLDDPDLIGPAVEEILRWASPAKNKMRVVTEDMDFHGKRLRSGDWIMAWLCSANRDDRKFDDPHKFDIRRDASEHLSLGAGIHSCLGRHLARLEMSVLIPKVLKTFPDLQPVDLGEPDWIVDTTVTGFRQMEVEYTPTSRSK